MSILSFLLGFLLYVIGGCISSFLMLNLLYRDFKRIDGEDIGFAIFLFCTSWFGVIGMLFIYLMEYISKTNCSSEFAKKITCAFERLNNKIDSIANKTSEVFSEIHGDSDSDSDSDVIS